MELLVNAVHVSEAFAQSPTGFVPVKRVSFMVGEHGPFTEDFRPAEFTDPIVRARLESVADAIRKIAG